MSGQQTIKFGVIGCGLMGREFASAVSRWCHLQPLNAAPRIVAVADPEQAARQWFTDHLASVSQSTGAYAELLANPEVDAVYCAVPHNLHARVYADVLDSGKHLLGEKPFGIDRQANRAIQAKIAAAPDQLVRCSSEMPFFPGAYRIGQWIAEQRFGRIIDVESNFLHSSDLNPDKTINWKRRARTNGEYGCMGDLGMHAVHMPLRFGWTPRSVRALLSDIVTQRPDNDGATVPCDTWDNAILACDVQTDEQAFPMTISTKRIAPGHNNTWSLTIHGTRMSACYSTKQPKQIAMLPYEPGGEQAWHLSDMPYTSAYPVITAPIFEFGFSDAIVQMWAAFCDELVNGQAMQQPFYCATPREAALSHDLFTAALESQHTGQTIAVTPDEGASTR